MPPSKKSNTSSTRELFGSVRAKEGLFTADTWKECIAQLYTLLQEDPRPGKARTLALAWTPALLQVKIFIDSVLQRVEKRYGKTARECLRLSTSGHMLEEVIHDSHTEPCVFSGRNKPLTANGVPVSLRLQRQFRWNQHHNHPFIKSTSLVCPHFSAAFVYEAQFSWLISGMHALGHICETLDSLASTCQSESKQSFIDDPTWQHLLTQINHAVYAVHVYVQED